MRTPVFHFEHEVLTDAPFDFVSGRLRESRPSDFKALRPIQGWREVEVEGVGLVLAWSRKRWGVEEQGTLRVQPDAKGSHLRIEGRMKGWMSFVLFGALRWHADRLLDRLVEEL